MFLLFLGKPWRRMTALLRTSSKKSFKKERKEKSSKKNKTKVSPGGCNRQKCCQWGRGDDSSQESCRGGGGGGGRWRQSGKLSVGVGREMAAVRKAVWDGGGGGGGRWQQSGKLSGGGWGGGGRWRQSGKLSVGVGREMAAVRKAVWDGGGGGGGDGGSQESCQWEKGDSGCGSQESCQWEKGDSGCGSQESCQWGWEGRWRQSGKLSVGMGREMAAVRKAVSGDGKGDGGSQESCQWGWEGRWRQSGKLSVGEGSDEDKRSSDHSCHWGSGVFLWGGGGLGGVQLLLGEHWCVVGFGGSWGLWLGECWWCVFWGVFSSSFFLGGGVATVAGGALCVVVFFGGWGGQLWLGEHWCVAGRGLQVWCWITVTLLPMKSKPAVTVWSRTVVGLLELWPVSCACMASGTWSGCVWYV